MKLIDIENKEQLDSFVKAKADCKGAEFLQSFDWGEIKKGQGEKIVRKGVLTDDGLEAIATLIKRPVFFGLHYWYIPRGPLGDELAMKTLLGDLKKDNRCVFIRIEPLRELIGRKAIDLQPKKTLLLDLGISEEELLKRMHQKTRYNIRLAEKKGVEIIEGDINDFDGFWELMKLTGKRDAFRLHGKQHYYDLLKYGKENIKIFFAKYNDKYIATAMFSSWGDKVTYLHGASDNSFRNVMAPYLLQWNVIKTAKRKGYIYYDFFGVDEKKWPGVTRFKLGFGGRVESYAGTFDYVCRPLLYLVYNITRKIRRMI